MPALSDKAIAVLLGIAKGLQGRGSVSKALGAIIDATTKSGSVSRADAKTLSDLISLAGGSVSEQEMLVPSSAKAPRNNGSFTTRLPRSPRGAPPLPGEEASEGEFHRTPNSSNVYGFSYDPRTSTLFVTYLAPSLHAKSLSFDKKSGALKGKLGSTVSGKRSAPGPKYAYLDVPARVYTRFQHAASAGKFVWDELRERGSIWGHKYRYTLVSGAIAPSTGAPGGIYVPRRVTKKGFQKRAVAVLGKGRRGFATNTIEAQAGFSTRKPRPRK